MDRKEKILAFIKSREYSPMTAEEISELLCVKKADMPEFLKLTDELSNEGLIIKSRKNRIFSSEKMGLIKGILKANAKGFGFILTEDKNDIYIPEKFFNTAMDGDTCLVKLLKKKTNLRTKNREGEILKVLQRANKIIVGKFVQERGYGLIEPDNERLSDEIFIEQRNSKGALNGQKVVCEFLTYESPTTSATARVIEILGFPNDFGVDVLSVIKSYNFPTEFSKETLEEAKAIPDINDKDLEGRLDLTENIIFTIDGDDTKDIDDAISIEKSDEGYKLGVHIADVSNYVKPGSAIDKEAFFRGTSVYLADRVIPMLPIKLSNGLCSLNEGEIRLTMTVFMYFNKNAELLKSTFHKSFIKSNAKMTYNNVKLILSEHPEKLCKKYKNIVPSLEYMYELSQKLHKKAKERGYVDFEIPEAKAVFDKNGKTTDIVIREQSFANNIIEEFMVMANSCVAKKLDEANAGGIFRVHEKPNEDRLKNTLMFMKSAGFKKCNTLQEAMEEVKGSKQETVISTMLLRSMAKARYDSENSGHFGLGLENYCHFTSPIRRYPDLVCHRALKAYLDNDIKKIRKLNLQASEDSLNCSERENDAVMCERDVLDIKKAEYMEQFVGEDFEGVISSVTNFGFFVMLPNTIEGLIRLENIKDDYYNYDEKTLTLTGERKGRVFTIGDVCKVRLASASKESRKIDFVLLEGGKQGGRKREKKVTCTKQKRSSRVFHRRKNRSRH